MKKLILLLLTALLQSGLALAIPAYPYPVQVRQPDGSMLTIRLEGDEYLHYNTTDDGFTVVKNAEGWYVYAEKRDGKLVATDLKAHDASYRSVAEAAWLGGIGKKLAPQMSKASEAMKQMNLQLQSEARSQARSRAQSRSANYDYSKFKGLVILVQFNDCSFSRSDYRSLVDDMMNKENYQGYDDTTYGRFTGSVRDYFYDNSNKLFSPQFTVTAPVTVNYSQYDVYDSEGEINKLGSILVAALDAADSQVDYSQFVGNKEGEVEMVYFIFAGIGSHITGNDKRLLWPHQSSFKNVKRDGVSLGRYACSVELYGSVQEHILDGIGTICHEFSHVLGLPDLYDTDYKETNGESNHPDEWSLMASGGYLNYCRTPAGYGLYERYAAGFAEPQLLSGEGCYQLNAIGESNHGFRIGSGEDNEFFLLENRQKSSKWDAYLPGHGMLVFRVEDMGASVWKDNIINADPMHNYYEMVRADGGWGATASDPFPGTKHVKKLTNQTLPANLLSWSGKAAPMVIDEIKETDGVIAFNLSKPENTSGDDRPTITPQSYAVNYWFDDMDELKGSLANPASGFMLDVSSLSDGLHALHIAVGEVTEDGDYIEIPPRTVYFEKHGQETKVTTDYRIDNLPVGNTTNYDIDNATLMKLNVKDQDDGLHQMTALVGLSGSGYGYAIASAFFQRVPTAEDLADQHLVVSINGVEPTVLKRAFEDNELYYDLDVHEMPPGLHDLTCQVKGSLSMAPMKDFFVVDPQMENCHLAVNIDGAGVTTLERSFNNGQLEYDLDVHEMSPGIHNLTYQIVGMVNMPPGKEFFVIDPKLESYEYWLNDDLSTAKAVTGLKESGTYTLNTTLPVQKMPLRSNQFYFNVEEGIPVTYAIDDLTMKVMADNGAAFIASPVNYINGSSRTPVGSELLPKNETTDFNVPATGDITWLYLKAKKDDVIGLQANQACTVQMYSPSGSEIIGSSGAASTQKSEVKVPVDGTYYVAIHDVGDGTASATVSLNCTFVAFVVIGDLNDDRKVGKTDLSLLVDYIMGKNPLGIDKNTADVNKDGKVNVADVTEVVKIIKVNKVPNDDDEDYQILPWEPEDPDALNDFD